MKNSVSGDRGHPLSINNSFFKNNCSFFVAIQRTSWKIQNIHVKKTPEKWQKEY